MILTQMHWEQQGVCIPGAGHRTVRTSKMLVRWLPVGKYWFHHGAHNRLYPCCGEPNETFEHLCVCPHKDLEALRVVAQVCILRALVRQEKFPTRLMQVVDMMLRKALDQERSQEL